MTGNTCAEHLAQVGRRLDEPGEDLVRRRRPVEPERSQQLDRRLPVPAGSRRRGTGERLEQRPVEEALVDLPDQRGLPFELGEQLVLAAHAERAREDGSGGGVRGELVRLQVAHDLQTVLERPKEPVGPAERGRIVASHVPLVGQDLEGAQRVRHAKALVPAAVDDLQELDRELHVSDPAATPLDLDACLARGAHVLLEADLDAADLVDRRLGKHLGEHERGDGLDERGPERGFARDGARLDQRLAFPGGGLRRVVAAHGLERPRQRTARAAGAEGGIDAERDPLGRRFGERADQGGARALGRLLPPGPAPLVDEHHVDVGGVVQLRPSKLPQRNDRETLVGDRAGRRGETRLRHRGDLGHDLLERRRRQVPGRDAQHRPPAEPPQAVRQTEPLDVLGELGVELRTRARRRRRPAPRPPAGARPADPRPPSRTPADGRRWRAPPAGRRPRGPPRARRRARATRGPAPGRARTPGTARAPATRDPAPRHGSPAGPLRSARCAELTAP